jgi:hypothetical protein
MSTRLRKLIGSLGVLAFLTAYIVVAVTVADHLPSQPLVQLLYFVVVGMAWGVPILPLFRWIETGSFRKPRRDPEGQSR